MQKSITEMAAMEKARQLADAKAQIKALQLKVAMLEGQLVIELFRGFTGTHYQTFDDGSKLKYSMYSTLVVDKDHDKVEMVLERIPGAKADMLMKWEPKASKTGYEALDAKERKIVQQIITIKDSKPTLEFVAAAK